MAVERRTLPEAHMRLSPIDRYLRGRVARAEAISGAIVAAGRGVRALAGRALERRRDERARRELMTMTDRELADIGLSRSDLYHGDLSKLGRRENPRRAGGVVLGGGESAPTGAANQNETESRIAS